MLLNHLIYKTQENENHYWLAVRNHNLFYTRHTHTERCSSDSAPVQIWVFYYIL